MRRKPPVVSVFGESEAEKNEFVLLLCITFLSFVESQMYRFSSNCTFSDLKVQKPILGRPFLLSRRKKEGDFAF